MGKAAKANPRKRQKGADGAAAAAAAVEEQEQGTDMTSLAAMEEDGPSSPAAAARAGGGGGGGGTRGRGRAAGPEAAPTPAAAAEDGAGPGSGRQRRGGRRGPGGGGTTSAAAGGDQQQQQPAGGAAAAAAAGGGGGKPPLAFSQHRKQFTADSDAIMEAVVKVFCIHTEPNFSLPWQRKRQYSSSSSGFMITGRRILTNAHCVDHHTQVKVKRRGSDKKFVASVLAVGTECDIAMLTVEDDAFWQGVEPVSFGGLPQLQEGVTVVGYPIGGDTMSVTSGVVSRIEVTSYVHGAAELLGIQIDAAINSGNSGGPAFNAAGQCIGIAFQSLKHEDAENIGYIIPQPVIDHFITDYERNGHYTGFPTIRAEWQKLENPDLRKALKMKAGHQGVLIRRVEPTAPEGAALKQWDILMAFDGVAIACDGTVPFRSGERIGFNYLVSQKYCKETAHVKLLRDGKELTCDIVVDAPSRLIPFHIKGAPPTYFIVAGLVFTPATVPYLRSEYGKEYDFDAPVKLLDKMMHGLPHAPGQQVVLLSQVLAAEVNIGYEDMLNTQVLSLNGTKLVNMAQLVALVDACSEPFLHFHLDYDQKLVLSTAHARASTKAILECHCIASDRSPDLMGDAAAGAAAAAANGQQEAGAADGKAAAGSHDPGPSGKSGGRRQRG